MDDNSHMNWFLTPSTTPTDATFSPATLHTPRTGTHFQQDAFPPYSQPSVSSSTPFLTAAHGTNSLSRGPSDAVCSPQEGAAAAQSQQQQQQQHQQHQQQQHHHHHQQQNHLPSFAMTSQAITQTGQRHRGQAAFHTIRPHAEVQTPPPTRNPSAKRRSRPQSMVFGTPASVDQAHRAPSRMDEGQRSMLSHSASQPLLPLAMDFSSQPSFMMPSHAVPEDGLWDFSASMDMSSFPQNDSAALLADPFTYQAQADQNGGGLVPVPSNEQIQFLATTPQLFTPMQPSPIQRAPVVPSNDDKPLPPVPSENAAGMGRTNAGVDPTMLFSSHTRMPPPSLSRPVPGSTGATQNDSLSPERIPQIPFPSSAASLAVAHLSISDREPVGTVVPDPKIGVRRSNTVETRRPHSMYGSIGSLSRSNTTSSINRRASPLKKYNRNSTTSLASISESTPSVPRSRTSVVLTVDSKGRARTERRTLDMSPTKSHSMMARYPSLWDDSGSDSDSDDTTGRDTRSRAAKIDSTLASLEGLHLPRSSSSASNQRATPSKAAVAAALSLRRGSSARKSYHGHSRRSTVASSVGSRMDADAMDIGSDDDSSSGDAGSALRKAMADRREQRERHIAQLARARPSSQSRPASSFPARSSSLFNCIGQMSQQQQQQQQQQPVQNSTTHDCAPAHTHGQSQSLSLSNSHSHSHSHSHSLSHAMSPQQYSPMRSTGAFIDMSAFTRCICNLPIADGQLMIQCQNCQYWLHTACLGMPPTDLPPSYLCHFCMVPPVQAQNMMGWETAAF